MSEETRKAVEELRNEITEVVNQLTLMVIHNLQLSQTLGDVLCENNIADVETIQKKVQENINRITKNVFNGAEHSGTD